MFGTMARRRTAPAILAGAAALAFALGGACGWIVVGELHNPGPRQMRGLAVMLAVGQLFVSLGLRSRRH
jgi:tetrahydromethanopterin S-methyltransferase subunit D